MKAELSRAAACIIRFVEIDKQESFTSFIENAETLSDVPQPYQNWLQGIELPGPIAEQLQWRLIKS